MSSVYISVSLVTGSTKVINQSAGIGIVVSLVRGIQGNKETSNPAFLLGVTKDDEFMVSSDKILTLCEPTPTLLEKYQDVIKE